MTAPITATNRLYRFTPVTPCAPNMLNTQPPTTAPTIPSTISRNTPSPVLFTNLLPMNPAINPNTIQAKIDMIHLLSTRLLVLLRLYRRQFCKTRGGPEAPPGFGGHPGHVTLKQPCCMHLSRAASPFCCKRPLTEMPPATVPQTAPSHPCPRSSEWLKR